MSVSGTRLFVSSLFFLLVANPVWADPGPKPLSVQPNENGRLAGTLVEGTLTLKLRAAVGLWSPEGETGPALPVEAFGEESGPLTAPSPLDSRPRRDRDRPRSIRNDLDQPLRVHGLCGRDGAPCAPVDVPPSLTHQLRLQGRARRDVSTTGATTTGMPIRFRAAADTQLSGAFIVDPVNGTPDPDRVLVITDWTSVTRAELRAARRRRRSWRRLPETGSAFRVPDQRSVLAGDRAPDLPARRDRSVAGRQPQFPGPSAAPAWLPL